MAFLTFHSVGNVIIPTDEVHHFSEGIETTNQINMEHSWTYYDILIWDIFWDMNGMSVEF